MLLQIPTSAYLLSVVVGILAFASFLSVGTAATVVQTKIGKIRGLEEITPKQTKYYAFKGVRYARAPIGDLRFKEPVPLPAWQGILDGTLDGPVCPQLHVATNNVIGEEDCLSLNIYTPDVDNLKPVIVFIHGGGFQSGSSHSLMYGPDYLIDENVVLVTFNYRLHVLGFLNTETKDATGNYGLFDQLQALEWVKSHIASFGGDPEKVTLMGEGAGAASASLLTLTPKSKGLFKNLIALGGGTPISSQYFQKNPVESSRELVSRFECSYEDFEELVECLRKQDVEKLVKEVNKMFSFFSFPRWFVPSVDNVLFSQNPEELIKDGKMAKVPVLTGLGRHEGAFYYPLTLNSFNDGKYDGNFIDQRLPRLLPVISEFESKLLPITKAVKKRYFTNIDIENEDEFRPRYIEFLTDMVFTRFTNRYANLLANSSVPVYYFLLDYYGTNSIMNVIGDTDMKLIAHGDTLQYIFTQVLGEEVQLPGDDKEFATKTFIPLLLNFAKSSNPTPSGTSFGLTWPKFNEKDQTVCLIGRTLSLQKEFRSSILKFWEQDLPSAGKIKEEL